MANYSTENAGIIRTTTRSAYDLQKLRIEIGNRIVANFRAKLGLDAQQKEEDDKEAMNVLEELRRRWKKITDGVTHITRTKNYDFDGVITNYAELGLLSNYFQLCKDEHAVFRSLGYGLSGVPIWEHFLRDVNGVGPAMAGIIISELDPHKAKYPSSFHAYAGLDTVTCWYEVAHDGEKLEKPKAVLKNSLAADPPENAVVDTEKGTATLHEEVWEIVDAHNGDPVGKHLNALPSNAKREGEIGFVNGTTYNLVKSRHIQYERITKGRSRRAEHLVEHEYVDANGEVQTRRGISFNPLLKTKLVGVLYSCFMRAQESQYKQFYYDYKKRLKDMPAHADKEDGHIHNMARRKMIKEFLTDLYMVWRDLEGLPVYPVYPVAKLGASEHNRAKRLGVTYADETTATA